MSTSDLSGSSDQLFGDLLRTLRRASGLTQAELAERANLSIRGLSDLERGINRSPRRETLLALSDALGLANEDRHRFMAAARRQSALASPSSSLPSSSSAERKAEPVLSRTPSEGAGPVESTDDIQVFLIADVRGYSTYTDAHQDEDAAKLALRFASLATAAVEAHGGQVLEVRGDEVLAVFTSARSALRAAIVLQEQVVQASRATPDQPIRCGIGVEAGEAVAVPGGYRGQAINLAARLCARAAAGEVLAGETVIGLARKVAGLVFQDLGFASLKGIAVPVRITQVVALPVPTETSDEPAGEGVVLPEPMEGKRQVAAVGNFLSADPRYRLVARKAEMTVLLAVLERVQAGTGQLVLLVGEPGVGKTRLAQEVLSAARAQGFGGITGRCYAPQASVPYYPFLEALAQALAAAAADLRAALPQRWPEVARLIPDQSLVTSASSMPHLGGEGGTGEQQRLFWQVTGFLEALAEEQPLALLVDDLHWSDGASIELLLNLTRQTRNHPVLLLGTYRESEVPWDSPLSVGVRDLIRAQLVERIELQQLTREETAALLSATLEGGEVAETVTDLIYVPTEGNAFFVQELLRTLLERGEILQASSGRWEPRQGAAVATVPATVQAAVLERVSRLSAPAQETLGLASVLGQRFRFDDLLATASQMPQTSEALTATAALSGPEAESRLEAALEEAMRVRLLREVGGEGYTFSHALAQRALYEQLSARRRRRVHRAAAESLEHLAEAERIRRVGDVAYHFLEAGERVRALPYTLLAGDAAEAVYAHKESERHYRMAVALAAEANDQARKAAALEKLSFPVLLLGRDDEARGLRERALELYQSLGDRESELRMYGHLLELWGPSALVRAQVLADSVVAEGAYAASRGLAALYNGLAQVYQASGRAQEQLAASMRAEQIARLLGDDAALVEALHWHAMAAGDLGEDVLQAWFDLLPLAERIGDLFVLRNTFHNIARIYLYGHGDFVRAKAYLEQALDVAERRGSAWGVIFTLAGWAECHYFAGEWEPGRKYAERATALMSQVERTGTYWALSALGMFDLAQGRDKDAEQYLGQAVALAKADGDIDFERMGHRLLAEHDLVAGHATAAYARLEPLLDREGLVEPDVNPLLPLLVWAHLDLGEVEAAEVLATETVARLRTQHDHLDLVDGLRMEAAVWIQQRRWVEAEAALDEALVLARQMSYPYAEAKLLATYGNLMVASGQQVRAREQYEAALGILRPLGEVPYAERIEQALAEIRRQ